VIRNERRFDGGRLIPTMVCPGLPTATWFHASFAQVELWFCADQVCYLTLTSYDREDHDRVFQDARSTYGAPALTEPPVVCTEEIARHSNCTLGRGHRRPHVLVRGTAA
jgi:hypothetical protein